MATMKPPRILTIAGSDSGGGAGIQADIKTVSALGGYAMSAITAITAQNTLGVHAVDAVSTDLLRAQIDACLSDIGGDAVKIGMVPSAEHVEVIAALIDTYDLYHKRVPIVYDPVMISTSGTQLMQWLN